MIDAFVVNVHDYLNYDIDMDINSINYKNIIVNDYTYVDVVDYVNDKYIIKNSKSFRCRLNGVGIRNKIYNKKIKNEYTINVKKLIDRADGWVKCKIYGIDLFNNYYYLYY